MERIRLAMQDAKVDRIDNLLITHLDIDHLGDLDTLTSLIEAGRVIGNGARKGGDPVASNNSNGRQPRPNGAPVGFSVLRYTADRRRDRSPPSEDSSRTSDRRCPDPADSAK